ncbi:hypothetical protein CKO09_02440 [Chromatium weissei]|nr:hypothetical protein [Chromatium weissei]
MSFHVFLQAIWDAVLKFQKVRDIKHLAGISIRLTCFEHDLNSGDEEDFGGDELPLDLLLGCLGGLEKCLQALKLPLNEDEAQRPRGQWQHTVPITLDLVLTELAVKSTGGSQRPNVKFCISISDLDKNLLVEDEPYRWYLDATQPERVRHECAKRVQRIWNQFGAQADQILPAFRVEQVDLTAMFFAADADEANRLVAQAMQNLKLDDLRADLLDQNLDHVLRDKMTQLIQHYRQWLDANFEHGYYNALSTHAPAIITAYDALATAVLDANLLGAQELLRRLYKAFLLIDAQAAANDSYLSFAVAWSLTPVMLELSLAQTRFLADGFPEVVAELATSSTATGKTAFNRLLNLSRIQRPITALVTNSTRSLSTNIRSFDLLQCIGEMPDTSKSLAVQTLLKEDESNDDENVSDIVRPCEEQSLIVKVLDLYRELHPFAQDGLRILAVNVQELPTILAGVDTFLKQILQNDNEELPPFYCTVTVYSTSSSPLTIENRLALWRERVMANHLENGRSLVLTVGHRFAPKHQIIARLEQERRIHDVAFLFHFLRTNMDGQINPALPFDMDRGDWNSFFPIAEYPRPIKSGARYHREMLISNRRLRIQTRHSDLSARLRITGHTSVDHVVYGQVDFANWIDVLQTLHTHSQWVACIDSFVDKHLLSSSMDSNRRLNAQRKIVGFESGLGAYGELNLTISTEQHTLDFLTKRVADALIALLPFEQSLGNFAVAERVVADAEEVIGLASLRAVLGQGEKIREVIGFAAIRRILTTPIGEMSQLLPLDAQPHWFTNTNVTHRPDLLQLTLEVRPKMLPLIHATVIECKLAGQNSVHEAKALAQVVDGLRHLMKLFAPRRNDLHRLSFDRRYWWAQLQRAIASRAVVTLSERDCQQLDHALENLAEGCFEIAWRGLIFTFWTDVAGAQPTRSLLTPNAPPVSPLFVVPSDFAIEQFEIGYQGLTAIFAEPESKLHVQPCGSTIRLQPHHCTFIDIKVVDEEKNVCLSTNPHDQFINTTGNTEQSVTFEVNDDSPLKPEPEQKRAFRQPQVAAFSIPNTVLIGTRTNGEPVYWHFGHANLLNRHLLIFGTAGSGKTYGIQCLLAEMANAGLRALIVDYTDGFLPGQVTTGFNKMARLKNHFVYTERLPLNPFRRQHQIIDPSLPPIEEGVFEVASRVQSIFASVFDMGDQQSAALIRSLQCGLNQNSGFSLDGLLPRLREDSPQGESLANKLEPLIQSRPFYEGVESAWDSMLTSTDHRVHVLQLKGLAREIQKVVTEFVLWDLWDYAQNTGNKNRPIPIVLDEIQNLNHGSASPLDKLLREGRKFGISLMLATQTTSQFNQEQRARLFQASHKLFFKPAATELEQFAQILDQATFGVSKAEWVQRLAKLEKGQCWSLGPVLKFDGTLKDEAVLVSVTSLDQRQLAV